ncbi:MAG: TolC family protein [Chthoniobacteraceae bacterium]
MKLFHLSLFCFFLSILVQYAAASPEGGRPANPAPLSLDEVTQTALANNASIKSALKKWSAMKARVPQAAAWDDLKINFMDKLDRFVTVQQNAFTDQVVSAEQTIPISGKNRWRARAAVAEALSTFEQVRRQELDVIAKTRASYFRLANICAQIELNRKNLVSLKQIAEISRSRYETGEQGAAFVFMAENEYSKLMETGRDLDQQLSMEQTQINVLMNKDAFAPVGQPSSAATFEPVIPSVEKLRALTLEHQPEVRMAEANVEQKKAIVQLAHREWIPDPAITVQAQRYNGASQGVSEVDAGISFHVPWLNYHKYAAEIHEAEDELDAAQQDLQRVRIEAVGQLRDALEKVETQHHHLQLFREKLVPQAQQAFEASRLAYQSGKMNFQDWIMAQRNLRDLESMARQHLSDYQVAAAELESTIGSNLTNFPTSKDPTP